MSDFTAKDVKALRDATGAGMMDAKKALTEAGGDAEAATQILREKGLSKAAKRSDRDNTDGAVALAQDGDKVAVVLLRSETDFSAKSDDFVAVAQKLADVALAGGDPAVDCATDIEDLMLTKKENIDIGAVHIVEAAEGNTLDTYLHVQDGRGSIGIVVEGSGVAEDALHSIALHCAFANPRFLDKSEVSEDDVAKAIGIVGRVAHLGDPIEVRVNARVDAGCAGGAAVAPADHTDQHKVAAVADRKDI